MINNGEEPWLQNRFFWSLTRPYYSHPFTLPVNKFVPVCIRSFVSIHTYTMMQGFSNAKHNSSLGYNSSCIFSSIVSMMASRDQTLSHFPRVRINLPSRRVPKHHIWFSPYPCLLPPHHDEMFFLILITLPFCFFGNHRSRTRSNGDAPAPCRLLGLAATLPGGAGWCVHCEEQAGDSDLPLDARNSDLLQV